MLKQIVSHNDNKANLKDKILIHGYVVLDNNITIISYYNVVFLCFRIAS